MFWPLVEVVVVLWDRGGVGRASTGKLKGVSALGAVLQSVLGTRVLQLLTR